MKTTKLFRNTANRFPPQPEVLQASMPWGAFNDLPFYFDPTNQDQKTNPDVKPDTNPTVDRGQQEPCNSYAPNAIPTSHCCGIQYNN